MPCPNCGTPTLPDDRFCEECGVPLTTPMNSSCRKCGAADVDAEGFCPVCGFRNLDLSPSPFDRIELDRSPTLAGVSDRGLRHDRNEDFLALQTVGDRSILVVCDGVSSSQTPELAAQTAANCVCEHLTHALQIREPPEIALKSAIAAAMTALCTLPHAQTEDTEPPSTTIVAAVIQDQVATIAWLGDSRAYWIGGPSSQQLTQDHAWLTDMIQSGKISAAEAQRSSNAHAITRWLGADATEVEPTIVTFPIPGPGHLLLCTDGLWNYAPETPTSPLSSTATPPPIYSPLPNASSNSPAPKAVTTTSPWRSLFSSRGRG